MPTLLEELIRLKIPTKEDIDRVTAEIKKSESTLIVLPPEDDEIIEEHREVITTAKKALYHGGQKGRFYFKQQCGKPKTLEVGKIMSHINKSSATYLTLSVLKNVGIPLTQVELADELQHQYPNTTFTVKAIETFLCKVSQLRPDIVKRVKDENSMRAFEYVSTIAEGDVDVAYAAYMTAVKEHTHELHAAKSKKRNARAKDEEKFGFKFKTDNGMLPPKEKPRLLFNNEPEFPPMFALYDALTTTLNNVINAQTELAAKIETLETTITVMQCGLTELETCLRPVRPESPVQDATIEERFKRVEDQIQTALGLIGHYICKAKNITDEELAVLKAT